MGVRVMAIAFSVCPSNHTPRPRASPSRNFLQKISRAAILCGMRKKSHPVFAPDVLDIRDSTLAYLQAHSHGRQGEIAKACGIRREQVNRYVNGAVTISDIDILARLAAWVQRDRAA